MQLYRIQNSDTVWVEEQTEVANETVKFFQNQFTEDSFPEDFELLENIPKLINAEQNENRIEHLMRQKLKQQFLIQVEKVLVNQMVLRVFFVNRLGKLLRRIP